MPVNVKRRVTLKENEEHGPISFEHRKSQGIDKPEIVKRARLIANWILPNTHILDIGSGTGRFAQEAVKIEGVDVHCYEPDEQTRMWCEEHINHERITFYEDMPRIAQYFDLVVALDVIEHIKSVKRFLAQVSSAANEAIFTTPNVYTTKSNLFGPPRNKHHVREYTPLALCHTLRCFYTNVGLYNFNRVPLTEKNMKEVKTLVAYCWND